MRVQQDFPMKREYHGASAWEYSQFAREKSGKKIEKTRAMEWRGARDLVYACFFIIEMPYFNGLTSIRESNWQWSFVYLYLRETKNKMIILSLFL